MHLELNLEQDILSLYTPYTWPGKRIQHTRSVLLQKRSGSEGEDTLFNILCSVTFNLVVSISASLPISSFIRFLILSYTKHAYDSRSEENDVKKHAPLDISAKQYLNRIDRQNRENHEYCIRSKLFHDTTPSDGEAPSIAWQWLKAGDMRIEDVTYREMRNINFIRDVIEIDIHNEDESFQNEVQYKIVLDNHLILLHLLGKLRYGQITIFSPDGSKSKYSARLLDPVCTSRSRYDLFKYTASTYLPYIEKQLNAKENPSFSQSLHFNKSYSCRGGLLQPSLGVISTVNDDDEGDDDINKPSRPHTITEMLSQAASSDALETTWQQGSSDNYDGDWVEIKQQKSVSKKRDTVFKVRHNPLFIDLSAHEHVHVEYFERLKSVAFRDPSAINKPKKSSATTTIKEAKAVNKNQPLLQAFVNKIPEESKRKYEPVVAAAAVASSIIEEEKEEVRPLKIPRIEKKQQATLNHFFK